MAEKRVEPTEAGSSYSEKVHADISRGRRIDPDYVDPEIKIKPLDNTKHKYKCVMCGYEYVAQKGNYYRSGNSFMWGGNNGYLPFCKGCCDIIYDSLLRFYSGNEEHALKHLCCIFGWYYSELASAMTRTDAHKGGSKVGVYASKLGTVHVARKGKTYYDTVRQDVEDENRIYEIDPSRVTDEDEFEVTKQMIRTWGRGFTPDQYQFLEEEYADWIGRNVCNTKAQEELFRNLSLAQLDVRTARQCGGDVDKAQKALQSFMNSANILPKQTADNLLADTQTFGTLLKKYEETRPIPEPDPSWKDVDGIRKYMNTWFRGGLAKALKVKNENAQLYDEAVEEFQRYTVEPVKATSAEVGNDTSIFDNQGSDSDE